MQENNNNYQSMLPIGTELQMGKYRVERYLSSGGFGNTYVVRNVEFDEILAMKEFFMKGVNDRGQTTSKVSVSNPTNTEQFDQQREKFKKEARRLRNLHNKHLVRVHDLFEENGTAYYVMDFVQGESLSARLKRTGQPLTERETLRILSEVLEALDEVHKQQIWHLDLKPGNIMLDQNGNAVLIDFGASKQLTTNGYATATASMCYTPGYAPSEQIDQNIERIGPWTDLYALGATLYNLLTRQAPPAISDLSEPGAFKFTPAVSPNMRKLIQWMMNPSRQRRPQSIEAVRNYLRKMPEAAFLYGTNPASPASPASPVPPVRPASAETRLNSNGNIPRSGVMGNQQQAPATPGTPRQQPTPPPAGRRVPPRPVKKDSGMPTWLKVLLILVAVFGLAFIVGIIILVIVAMSDSSNNNGYDNWDDDYTTYVDSTTSSEGMEIRMKWNFYADVDLHVTEPNGHEIYYMDKTSSTGGTMENDNLPGGSGAYENITWSDPPTGDYQINVVYYSKNSDYSYNHEGTVTVTVLRNGVEVDEYEVYLSPSREKETITAGTYTVY